MPTVIVGSALDIVEHCGVPRFLFVDFPLGNPCGRPGDVAMQKRIVRQALELFEIAETGQTTIYCSEKWGSDEWRERYMEVTEGNRAELARKGDELRQRRANRQRRS